MPETDQTTDVAALTVQLLSAYLANNTVASHDLSGLIRSTKIALSESAAELEAPAAEAFTPAISVRRSLASPEHIISLIDGKPYKTLKRHLSSQGLTPDEYRSRYDLPANYPMVAPDYAAHRRDIAQKIGLGNRRSAPGAPVSADDPASQLLQDGLAIEPSASKVAKTPGKVKARAADKSTARLGSGDETSPPQQAGQVKSYEVAGESTTSPPHEAVTSAGSGALQPLPTAKPHEPGPAKTPAKGKRGAAAEARTSTAVSMTKSPLPKPGEASISQAKAGARKRRGKIGLFKKAESQQGHAD
jgi:predicted transcriptional regulator